MTLRRTVSPALWALRTYRGTAVLLVATAATALAAALPVTSLAVPSGGGLATRLGIAPWRGEDLGMSWSPLAWSPTATRHAALLILFRLLLGVVAGVLAVAGLTIISLSAARALAREPELTVRRAVGASQQQLLAAGLVESGASAAGALIMGSVLGMLAGRLATAAWPGAVGPPALGPNAAVLAAALAGVILCAVLPLALPRRTSPLPGTTGKPLELVVPALQLGLSLTVLTTATLLQREAVRLMARGGTRSGAGEVFQVTTRESLPAVRAARYASLLHRFGGRPRLGGVSLTSPGTLAGLGMVDVVTTDCGACAIDGIGVQWLSVFAIHYLVSADTFRTLGLSVIAGRGITDADGWAAPRVAVVNRFTAARDFQRGQAVGRQIRIGRRPGEWYTVVGVVEDHRPTGFGGGLQPPSAVYLSVLQHPAPAVDLLVRASPDSGIIAAIDRGLRDMVGASGGHAARVSASRLAAQEGAPFRWFGDMFGMEGWVLLTIATMGTFVVMRLWIASLLYELGVRRAVGARRQDVLGFVMWRAAVVAIGGVAIGLWVGLLVWGTLATVVAGLPQWDVHAALRIAPLLVGATLAGALLPAWRAARAAPATIVRAGAG